MDPNVLSGAGLLRLTLQCRKVDKELSAAVSLTIDELHCLSVLYLEQPECVKELNELLGLNGTRTSKILRTLERKGYVVRTLHQVDHRMEQVTLTADGVQVAEKLLSLSGRVGRRLSVSTSSAMAPDIDEVAQFGD